MDIMKEIEDYFVKKGAPIKTDVSEGQKADDVDPVVVVASTDTPKQMSDGGVVSDDDKFEDPVPGPEWGRDFYPDSSGYKHITEYGTADDGGIVDQPSDDGSVDLSQLPGATTQPPPPTFDPNAGLPPKPLVSQPVTAPTQGSVSPDISQYIAQQKASNNQYGPQQQQQVLNDILQRQNGTGGRIAGGLANFADGLVQSVARAGNPGFAQNLQNKQNAQAQMRLEGLQNQRQAQQQNVASNQKLDAMDPNSTLSKTAQASQGLTLAALGFDPKTISKMSAAEIPEAISTLKDLGLKDREIMVAKYKANIEANQLAESTRHNQAEEANARTGLAQTAKQQTAENALKGEEVGAGELEHAANVPLLQRIANKIPGIGNPAQAQLQNQALSQAAAKTPQDAQAISWAQSHPNDPRALQILKLHGLQ